MKKKVLFAATTAKGHMNVFHLPYIRLFQEHGWEVHVVTNGDEAVPGADREFSIPIQRSPFRFQNLIALKQLISLMKREKYDFVTCHTPMGGVLTRIAAFLTKTSPVMYTAHGFHFFQGASVVSSLIYKNMERFLAHWTDALVTMNQEDFSASFQFHLRKGGARYKIPGIGVDLKKIQQCHINKEEKRKEFGISADAFVVLNIGEMIPRKNQKTVLQTAAKCRNKKIFFLICGRGEEEYKLKQNRDELGLQEQVFFAGFRKDIDEMLQIADLFFFPSFQEGLPVSVMEAMAAGLPVICSNVRGNCDLIDREQGGYLFAPEAALEFAASIDALSENAALCQRMGSYNKDKAQQYDKTRVLRRMEEIYLEVLKEF